MRVLAGGRGRSALERAARLVDVRTTVVAFGLALRLAMVAVLSSLARRPMPSMISRVLAYDGPSQVRVRRLRDVDHVPGWPQQWPADQV